LRQKVAEWWLGLSPFPRHLIINICVAAAVGLVLRQPFVQDNASIAAARAQIISAQMNLMVRFERGSHNGPDVRDNRLAWINIDDNAYRAWGVPLMTRRDKLRDLIAFAVKGKPRAVLVDIALTDANATNATYGRYDSTLQQYLEAYPKTCVRPCPAIILPRLFGAAQEYAYTGQPPPAKRALPSFLDASLGTSAQDPWRTDGPVVWASVEADHESDSIIRHWRLWEVACNAAGPASVIPSAPLLAVALLGASPAANPLGSALSKIKTALVPHGTTCARESSIALAPSRPTTTTLDLGYPFELTEESLQRLIVYSFGWAPPGTSTQLRTFDDVLDGGAIAANSSADPTYLQGQIVVIGSSFPQGGDIHATPVGEMPGSLILINEMNSLLNDRELKPNLALTTLVELACIVIIGWLFTKLRPAEAILASLAVIFVLGQGLALLVFRSGIWIDTVVPLLGVVTHEIIEQTHDRAARIAAGVAATIKSRFT
jgi:CHASE2 domain-containing sensor protein